MVIICFQDTVITVQPSSNGASKEPTEPVVTSEPKPVASSAAIPLPPPQTVIVLVRVSLIVLFIMIL